MYSFQNEKQYRAILKTLVFYVDKIIIGPKRPDMTADDSALYLSRLSDIGPALSNLALELNMFYNAELIVPPEKFQAKVKVIESLAQNLKMELEENPHFKEISPLFDLKSPDLLQELHTAGKYVENRDDDYFNAKSAYFLQHVLAAMNTTLVEMNHDWQNELWQSVQNSKVDVLLLNAMDKGSNAGISPEDINLGIYWASLKSICEPPKMINGGLLKVLLDSYHQQQIKEVYNPTFISALNECLPEIKAIINHNFSSYNRLKIAEHYLLHIGQKVDYYGHKSITEIIEEQKPKLQEQTVNNIGLENIKLTQKDVDLLLREYDYRSLVHETKQNYEYHKKYNHVFKDYEKRCVISPEVINYFAAKYKLWCHQTAIDAAQLIQGQSHVSSKTIEEMLDCAKNIIIIGRLSPDYFTAPDDKGNPRSVRLDTSGQRLGYIENLLDDPAAIQPQDMKVISNILLQYNHNYKKFIPVMGLKPQEQEALVVVSKDEYIYLLNQEKPGFDKQKYILYSERLFEAENARLEKDIELFAKDFGKKALVFHKNSRQYLADYLKDGSEIFSELKETNFQPAIESLITIEVLVPFYAGKDFDSHDFEESVNDCLDELSTSPITKDFIKSAAIGYQRKVLKAHQEHSPNSSVDIPLREMAKYYEKVAEIYDSNNRYGESLEQMADEQELWSKMYQRHKTYRQTQHPDNNEITKMILNTSKIK